MEADRQEEGEGEHRAADGRDPRPEAEQDPESDGDLAERDQHAKRCGELQEVAGQRMDGADALRGDELSLDAGRAVGIEEVGIGQLLHPREHEGGADEESERQQGPAGERPGTWRRRQQRG